MKANQLINFLNAVPGEFEVDLNGDYGVNEITINFDEERLSVVVPEVILGDETDLEDLEDFDD